MAKLRQNENIKYSKNLSSFGIWKSLTDLIEKPLTPLILYTKTGVELCLTCTALTCTRARKIAYQDAQEMLPTMFMHCMHAYKNQLNLKELFETGLERNIVSDHIEIFLRSPDMVNDQIDKNKVLSFVTRTLNDYYTFRKDILNRYSYLIESLANRQWSINKKHGLIMDMTAMQNIFCIAAYRGIDKFIPSKGTLTSYIQQWLVAARASQHLTFDNEAVTLDRNERYRIHSLDSSTNNKSIPIEDRKSEFTVDPVEMEDGNTIRHIARHRYATLFFLCNNLDYPLTRDQKERIHAGNLGRPALGP